MNRNITGSYFICGNEVFVEGRSLGQFQAIETEDTRRTIAGTATIKMPFYTIAASAAKIYAGDGAIAVKRAGKRTTTYVRVNPNEWNLKTGARIQVYTWYHNNPSLGQTFEKRLEFDGFIREVIGGFPTVIKCEDAAFILRFGTVTRSWDTATKLNTLVEEMCNLANKEFAKFRQDNGFSMPVPKLVPSGRNMDSAFVLKPATGVSPYWVIEKVVVGMYKLYSNVTIDADRALVYCGLGVSEADSPTINLDTSVNVVARDIVPRNLLFENFKVTVRFIEQGELKSITKGAKNGIPYELPFTPNRTALEMEKTALSVLAGLRANRNQGTITTLLYPEVRLFDYINYTDTIFTTLSGGYYVIGRKLTCGDGKGYRQILTVCDKTFLYLAS